MERVRGHPDALARVTLRASFAGLLGVTGKERSSYAFDINNAGVAIGAIDGAPVVSGAAVGAVPGGVGVVFDA